MAQTFATWQGEYAARHIPTFPINATADNGSRKIPGVTNYQRMGLPASRQLVLKGLDADGIACMAGARNKLSVVDIDATGAEADRLMAEAQRLHGRSRFIVRSGRGGLHAYYRYNGEERKIRPDPRRPIDILGGGVVVLPPSRGASRRYEIIEGTLDDLTALTKIKLVTPSPIITDPATLRDAQIGERDKKFWPYVARMAHQAKNLMHLIEIAMELNDMFPMPLTQAEINAKCKYWWDKTARGENHFGIGRYVSMGHTIIDTLMMTDPDAFTLLMFLHRHHWGRDFAIANETSIAMPAGGPASASRRPDHA